MRAPLVAFLVSWAVCMSLPSSRASASLFPEVLSLPDGFQPEGIASGRGRGEHLYVGSLADGSIYQIHAATGQGSVFIQGEEGRMATGLKIDHRTQYLFAAGHSTGFLNVYDMETRQEVASYFPSNGSVFLNDLVITPDGVFVTNSYSAELYLIPLSEEGALPDAKEIVTIPLQGDWNQQGEGVVNANGIVAAKDGKSLIVVNSYDGMLFKVDAASGTAEAIDTKGESLTKGDGMLLLGKMLYVVRNVYNVIEVMEMSSDFLSATWVSNITSTNFDSPTTVTKLGDRLYLPNAKFTSTVDETTPFEVVQVPVFSV